MANDIPTIETNQKVDHVMLGIYGNGSFTNEFPVNVKIRANTPHVKFPSLGALIFPKNNP